jgi:hypothetical protein
MQPDMDALHRYREFVKQGVPEGATAALLVLAEATNAVAESANSDMLAHQLCMGIRHGLFGAHATPDVSILGSCQNGDHARREVEAT